MRAVLISTLATAVALRIVGALANHDCKCQNANGQFDSLATQACYQPECSSSSNSTSLGRLATCCRDSRAGVLVLRRGCEGGGVRGRGKGGGGKGVYDRRMTRRDEKVRRMNGAGGPPALGNRPVSHASQGPTHATAGQTSNLQVLRPQQAPGRVGQPDHGIDGGRERGRGTGRGRGGGGRGRGRGRGGDGRNRGEGRGEEGGGRGEGSGSGSRGGGMTQNQINRQRGFSRIIYSYVTKHYRGGSDFRLHRLFYIGQRHPNDLTDHIRQLSNDNPEEFKSLYRSAKMKGVISPEIRSTDNHRLQGSLDVLNHLLFDFRGSHDFGLNYLYSIGHRNPTKLAETIYIIDRDFPTSLDAGIQAFKQTRLLNTPPIPPIHQTYFSQFNSLAPKEMASVYHSIQEGEHIPQPHVGQANLPAPKDLDLELHLGPSGGPDPQPHVPNF